MDQKRCTQCGETKRLDEFHRRKRAKDGRQAHCRVCRAKRDHKRDIERTRERRATDPEFREREREYHRERRHDPEYRERRNKYLRERYANDPEYRESRREYQRAYQREYQRERRANDPEYRERLNERQREWYWDLSGVELAKKRLRERRYKALGRMAERNEDRPEESPAKHLVRAAVQARAEHLHAEEIQRRSSA